MPTDSDCGTVVLPDLATEFPDYPADALPPCPPGFVPTHWHNDSCPTFREASGSREASYYRTPDYAVMIACDYPAPEMREFPDSGSLRFSVHMGDEVLFDSDHWYPVLIAVQYVAIVRRLGLTFHPDTRGVDYVYCGEPSAEDLALYRQPGDRMFSDEEANDLDNIVEAFCGFAGSTNFIDPYEVTMQVWKAEGLL
jgi:hypothetical protein